VLWIIGGWGNRSDSLQATVDRLQRSLSRIPAELEKYGSWGIWQRRDADEVTESSFESIDVNDPDALADAIRTETEQVRRGPNTAPGMYVHLSRPAAVPRPATSSVWFEYTVRVGFVDRPRPHNHITFGIDDHTDERTLMGYMSALADAWQPDHLGAVTLETRRAQGAKGPQIVVGRLTYIRHGIPFNTGALGGEVEVAEADGGRYIRVPGTPVDPSLEHIRQVRDALGYPPAD
jgi:hypothetical protein